MSLKVGAYTYGNPEIMGQGNNVTIGKFCSIATGVKIDGGFNHNVDFISTFPFHQFPQLHNLQSNIKIKGDVVIGSDVWIATDAVIMSGVTVGHGAVIGMRCIVSKDVSPYSVVVGAPQKVLRKRFSDEKIAALLKLQWWDMSDDEIISIAPLLQSNRIDELLKKYNLLPNLQT